MGNDRWLGTPLKREEERMSYEGKSVQAKERAAVKEGLVRINRETKTAGSKSLQSDPPTQRWV